MILAMELILTFGGLYLLIMGKGWGKNSVKHWHYRLLGGFMMTAVPAVFAVVFTYSVIWAVQHRGASAETFKESTRWPITGLEFGIIVVYAIVTSLWERSIGKNARAAAAAAATPVSENPAMRDAA